MGRKDSLPEDAPAPRLCELVKWPHFQGYGFNLHSEKGKEGQFIGKIDPSSPAEACGLQEGDQIIEVNGVNTSNENHKQVVERIKTNPDRASLLVVDAKTAEYYKKRNIVVKGSLPNVRRIKCAATGPGGPAQDQETGESETSSQDVQDGKSQPAEKTPEKEANGTKHASPTIDTTLQVESGSDRTQPSPAPSASSTGTAESSKSAESGPTAADGDKFGLKLNMTAAEMREYLKSKKRHDPRNDNLTFKQRHEIVSNM